MKNLGQDIIEELLTESNITDVVVIYPGRFQPMGRHHAAVYKKLASKYGKTNTYIATSDKVALPKSPLNFQEKLQVIKRHGITNVVQVKNPYQSIEITSQYDPETTAVLFAIGKKDMEENPRFRPGTKRDGSPSYFQDYEKNKHNLKSYQSHGYLIVAPHVDIDIPGFGEMSGTTLRKVLATASPETFEDVMGFYDESIYNMLRDKFADLRTEMIETFLVESSTVSFLGKAVVDDGPRYFYGNQKTYQSNSTKMANRLGFEVMSYLTDDKPLEVHNTDYPDGPPMTVSFFPTGIKGTEFSGTDYLKDARGSKAYNAWMSYIDKVAQQVGFEFLDFLGAEVSIDSSKSEDMSPQTIREVRYSTEWWKEMLNEVIVEAAANTHLTHLEELILTKGAEGYKQARSVLLELLKNLRGHSDTKVNTTVKWDGAPAIFCGVNPDNGKFFVGTKSIFNKEPKINYTPEDIEMNHGHAPGLADKLVKALQYLPKLGIKNILQGDFMFDKSSLQQQSLDGVTHYTFRPNTITYAVEADSDLGKRIAKADFGIVFHTSYDSLTSPAQFGADVSNLKKSSDVWFDDAFFKESSGTVLLTAKEAKLVASKIKAADSIRIDYENIPAQLLNTYINSEIRTGNFLENPKASFRAFKAWYQVKVDKKVDKLKSERGKAKAIAAGEEAKANFDARQDDIIKIFKLTKLLAEAKMVFVNKYNNAVYRTKHFKDDGQGGLVATAPEGYVAIDRIGNGVKLVDRLEFSRANFAMDKGFAKK